MVAEADTAVSPEQDTAAAGFEAPPEETQPETTETPVPETETAEATPETEAPADPLASIDPDVLFNHPAVKDRLARENESVRRRSERETEQRIQDARSSWVATGQAFQDVHAALAEGNIQQAQNMLGAALANRDWQAVNVIDRIARSKLEGAKVSTEDIDRLDAALNAAQRGTGTLDAYAETLLDVRAKAYAETTLAPQIEARIRKEMAQSAKAAQQTQKVQQAEATNAEAGRPTLGVPGNGRGAVGMTSAELDAMPTEVWRMKSREERARLLAEARANDARTAGS